MLTSSLSPCPPTAQPGPGRLSRQGVRLLLTLGLISLPAFAGADTLPLGAVGPRITALATLASSQTQALQGRSQSSVLSSVQQARANGFASVTTLAANTSNACTSSFAAPGNGRKLWAIYVIGSDLESGSGFATGNFAQLVVGWQALASRDQIDIIVAFGGADKDGWRGVKLATMDQLVADGADGIYGNGSDYLYRNDQADMGSQSTFEAFLKYVGDRYSQDSLRLLTFWDHGTAYQSSVGIGPDENSGNVLDLTRINQGLANTGSCYQLVGFDACLMANLGSARAIRDFAQYMVASEELEPGHGWNYTHVLNALAANNSPLPIGKAMVDSFVDAKSHATAETGKTLSVLDLSKLDGALAALDSSTPILTAGLQTGSEASAVIPAYFGAQRFGGGLTVDTDVSPAQHAIDAVDFLQLTRARTANAATRTALDATTGALAQLVAYSRQDGTRPYSLGVAVAPLDLKPSTTQLMVSSGLLPASWGGLINAYRGLQASVTSPPVPSTVATGVLGSGQTFVSLRDGQADAETTANQANELGILASFDSPYLAQVRGATGILDSEGSFILLAEQPAFRTAPGAYFMPQWNGQGFVLQSSKDRVILPLLLVDVTNAASQYSTLVVRQRAGQAPTMALLSLSASENGMTAVPTLAPIVQVAGGFVLDRDSTDVVAAGDTLTLFTFRYPKSGTPGVVQYATHTFAEAPQVVRAPLTQGNYAYSLSATDIGDGDALAAIQPVADVDRVYNWASVSYPQLQLNEDSFMVGDYYSRCNEAKTLCLGTRNGEVSYTNAPNSGSLGALSGWTSQAKAAGY